MSPTMIFLVRTVHRPTAAGAFTFGFRFWHGDSG